MSKRVYAKGHEAAWAAAINLTSDTIKAALLSSGYTFNTAHEFVTDLGANIVARSPALSSKTFTSGVFNAANTTLTAVTGSQVTAIAVYKDTGVDSTSRLICYIDAGTGLPVTPNGADIILNWHDTNGIFALSQPTS